MKVTQNPGTKFVGPSIPIHIPNETQQNDPRFYISYNPSGRDYRCKTTALVLNHPIYTQFFILEGDHRKQYEEAGTLEKCCLYFANNKDYISERSDPWETLPKYKCLDSSGIGWGIDFTGLELTLIGNCKRIPDCLTFFQPKFDVNQKPCNGFVTFPPDKVEFQSIPLREKSK